MFDSIADHSADVQALAAALVRATPGAVVSWSDLDQAIGRPSRRVPWLVQRALKLVNDEQGAIFENVVRVGYRRLSADEAAKISVHARHRLRRIASRAQKRINNAVRRANNLDPAARRQINRELSVLGLLQHIATEKAVTAMPLSDDHPIPAAIAAQQFMAFLGAA